MFGRRKQDRREEIENILAQLNGGKEQLKAAEGRLAQELKAVEGTLTACGERVESLNKDIGRQLKRHSEAIEDLLEEKGSQETVTENYERQIKEALEREKRLLALLCHYQEEFSLLEEKLCIMELKQEHAEGWSEQFALFKKSLEGELRQCAIEETGRAGETADYRYHEILDAEDTVDEKLEGTVAHCYKPGCIYHGKVITKAQVRVYRRKREA